jgi:CHAD domain-containing protein
MGPSEQDEIERKYDVDPRTVFPNLAEVEGVMSVRPPEEFQLEAVYFDTPRLDLARKGITLRRRSGGRDAGWHLKLPVGPDTRTEVHEPLGDDAESVPAPLRARVRALVLARPLAPIAKVSTVRREYALGDGDGTVLAWVCDDEVKAQRLEASQGSGGSEGSEPVQSWREWELELERGAHELLDAVEERLLAAGALPAASASKLARALGGPPPDERPQPSDTEQAEGATGQLLLAHLAQHTARLREQDAGVRAGTPEAIHRLRIAARRLRSALTTFGPLLDREVTDPVREELRWLGESLAEARDAQVLREHLTGLLAGQPPELVIGSVGVRIDDQLSAAFQTGRERALETLDSERYLRLLDTLDDLIDSAPLTPGADVAAQKGMSRLLARDVKRLRRAVRAIDDAEDPTARDIALHEARKKAKRLRYAAEMATPALGKQARSLGASAKKVQQALGIHQDSVIARERLREYGVQAHLEGDNTFTFGRLHALEQSRGERAESDFAKAWRKFRHKRLHRWVG